MQRSGVPGNKSQQQQSEYGDEDGEEEYDDEYEEDPEQRMTNGSMRKNDPVQRELSQAIDAYQKQMKDFKNSLADMDKKFSSNAISSPLNDFKLPNATLSSNLAYQQESSGGIVNKNSTIGSIPLVNNIAPINNSPSLHSTLNKQPQLQDFRANATLPNNSNKNFQSDKPQAFHTLDKEFADNKQSPASKLTIKPNVLYQDEDDDFKDGINTAPGTNKYYNFDNGYQGSESLLNKNYKIEQSSLKSSKPVQQQQQQSVAADQSIKSNNQQQQKTIDSLMESSNHYKNVQRDRITLDELNRLKEEFLEQEERDRLNPQNVLLRMLFIHAFNDGEEYHNEEMTLERKLYSFFVNKNSNVIDVKNKIRKEFGFDVEQLHIYFKYKELKNISYIMDIERFDIEEDILICISLNAPKTHLKVILREPLDDIKIADVCFLNSRDRSEPGLKNNSDFPSLVDMSKFDVDQDKLPWPFYRDWTAEAAYLSDIIVKNKKLLLSDEQQYLLQQGQLTLNNSAQLQELIEAEAAYRRLAEEFRRASLYAVHLVVKKNPTPLNLFNLYGDDGDKYIVGGILIRRAKDWTVCGGHSLSESSAMTTTINGVQSGESGQALIQISGKIASLDVRNLALMRNRLESLVVPLAAMVDYYGLKFETQSLAPLSINTLAYGSDTDGLLFTDSDPEAEQMARVIGQTLNLKVHFMEEQATQKIKKLYLPYTVQLHRNRELGDADKKLYLVNPFRIFPQDESMRQSSQANQSILDLLSRQLRPELVINNNRGEPAPNMDYYTWKKPTKCDECGSYILDYQYYYFEKRSVDKQQKLLVQYYCCLKCYNELLPTERFKYPVNKIVLKELPMKDRLEYWEDRTNGRKYYELQYRKIPLNSDAFMEFANTKDKQEKISDQEEVLRAGQKLKDEILSKLVEDLNNVDEDPLSTEQLAVTEVIARSAKILVKDGLTFLADDEEAGFRSENIKKCARKKFQVTIERDVLHKIHLNSLLLSICQKLNIKLNKPIKEILFHSQSPQDYPNSFLVLTDIDNIIPTVKDYQEQCMSDIALIAPQDKFPSSLSLIRECARIKDEQGKRSLWYMVGGDERVDATELYRMAIQVCETIYGSQQCIEYARVLKEFAEHLESRHQERGRPENSRWNRSFAIPEDVLSMEARYYYQNALQAFTDIKQELSIEAAEIHIALARLFKPRSSEFSHYREQENNIADMFKSLNSAIDIYETLLGFDHPETADAYTKMSLAYQENGFFQGASPWIRRAFCIFFKCFGPHDQITLNCWEQLKAIESNIDSKIDQVPYEELPIVIMELEKQQRLIEQQQQQMMIAGGNPMLMGRSKQNTYIPAIQTNNQGPNLMLRN